MTTLPATDRKPDTWPSTSDMAAVSSSTDEARNAVEEFVGSMHGLIDADCAPSLFDEANHPGPAFVGNLSQLIENVALNQAENARHIRGLTKVRDALALELTWAKLT